MIEMLKIILSGLAPFVGGGLAGAVLGELFRRRRDKVQRIPLIERVNRAVNEDRPGITLARTNPGSNELEKVRNLREYQLTLRNTSTVHLQDVEIQFEFPVEDAQAWISRPVMSKTVPVPVDVLPAEPWKKAFRWRIPQFPSGDSLELTFQAVNPPSELYEVALYKIDRVIIEKVMGEPDDPKRASLANLSPASLIFVLAIAIAFATATWEVLETRKIHELEMKRMVLDHELEMKRLQDSSGRR